MKRKEFLKAGLLAAAATPIALSSCAEEVPTESSAGPNIISTKKHRWKMCTTWPPNFPVLGEVANHYAEWVRKMSAGRIDIRVYGGGELVPALEAFDAVSGGAVEMGSGGAYYWAGKSPAAQFFASIPFGMNAQQVTAWLMAGGGYEIWKEVYAKFNVVPFLGGNTGVQMGGWFNKEINSIDDLKGLKMRIPGVAGKVLEKAGGAPVLVAGGEIYTSLERGVIDATEWIGPYHDYKMGFHKIAKYYYVPGWHEAGTQLEFFVNKSIYEDLPEDLQEILSMASMRAQAWVLAEFDAQNSLYLEKLIKEEDVQIRTFPKEVLQTLKRYTDEAVQELIETDPLSKKAYESYDAFRKRSKKWYEVTEKAYYNDLLEV